MISAIAIVCSLSNPLECATISAVKVFPTVEMCKEGRVGAEEFALARGFIVVDFRCFNWGKSV